MLQVLAVLEAMGGSLKSEDEALALQQEEAAKKGSGTSTIYTAYSVCCIYCICPHTLD
jgi:hypothetical protein